MVKVFEKFDLSFEGLHHAFGPSVVLFMLRPRELHLLNSDSLASVDTEPNVNVAECATPDQVSFDPLVRD